MREPILAHFDPELPTELRVDASNQGLGAHLVQIKDNKKHLSACASRTLTPAERNYSTTEKECLAIVWSVGKFRPYLFGRKFTIITDHCGLCFLMSTKDLTNRLARWSLKLMDYNFDIVYNKGLKHADADFLSRNFFTEEKEKKRRLMLCVRTTDTEQIEQEPEELNNDRLIKYQTEDQIISRIREKMLSQRLS